MPTLGLVEMELRRRAEARGLHIGSSLPEGALLWVPYLLKREFYDALRREAPLAVGGERHSIFVDMEGRLHLACRRDAIKAGKVGEPLMGHVEGYDWESAAGPSTMFVPPTLVPSMQDKRIVSVATSDDHCLALSAEGEVYSWGDGSEGGLGHADGSARVGPSRIETLARVEVITVGCRSTNAAVDDRGRLFTWGRATGLGYELNPETEIQLTPKWVDALSEDRVVGVARASSLTLVVTDAGAVFSCGKCSSGTLGHGSFRWTEVLPRRIEALEKTGRRFFAVAAGLSHGLALTEEGQVYGWGYLTANGQGQPVDTPRLVPALRGVRVKRVHAQSFSSCAVTEKGELYTWGSGYENHLQVMGRVPTPQETPKRVEALRRVKVVAAVICDTHTLVANAHGMVWAFGERSPFSLGCADAPPGGGVVQPTSIPNLRVRTLP